MISKPTESKVQAMDFAAAQRVVKAIEAENAREPDIIVRARGDDLQSLICEYAQLRVYLDDTPWDDDRGITNHGYCPKLRGFTLLVDVTVNRTTVYKPMPAFVIERLQDDGCQPWDLDITIELLRCWQTDDKWMAEYSVEEA